VERSSTTFTGTRVCYDTAHERGCWC
jgi:hypothetical protein